MRHVFPLRGVHFIQAVSCDGILKTTQYSDNFVHYREVTHQLQMLQQL